MGEYGKLKAGGEILLVLAVLVVVLGQLLGQPILLGYVTSDSMEPTIQTGDGFVAVPAALAGPIEEGDVVVYRAQEIDGGGLTTHRVVDVTEEGFITKGDGNPFTDQENTEPIVKPEQITTVVWQPGGVVITIPALGTVVNGIQGVFTTIQTELAALLGISWLLGTSGLAYLLFVVTLLLYALDVFLESDRTDTRERDREGGTSTRVVVGLLALLLVAAAVAVMTIPAGTHQREVVSSEFDADRPDVIQQGTTKNATVPLTNGGAIPVYVFLESDTDNVEITPQELTIDAGDARNATVTITAPDKTGPFRYFVSEHRYLAVLPKEHIAAMYRLHSWLPIVVIGTLLGVPFYLIGTKVVGTGRVRNRSRDGEKTIDRISGFFR